MSKTPKRRKLPRNTVKKSDSEVAEKLFGKRAKRELDRIATATSKPVKEPYHSGKVE